MSYRFTVSFTLKFLVIYSLRLGCPWSSMVKFPSISVVCGGVLSSGSKINSFQHHLPEYRASLQNSSVSPHTHTNGTYQVLTVSSHKLGICLSFLHLAQKQSLNSRKITILFITFNERKKSNTITSISTYTALCLKKQI